MGPAQPDPRRPGPRCGPGTPGRYLRLLGIFYKNRLSVDAEYRSNFLVGLGMTVFWNFQSVIVALTFFSEGRTLAGWTLPEALILLGLFKAFFGILDGFLRPNLRRLIEGVRDGTFDFLLLKPVNAQFMVSTRYLEVAPFLQTVTGGIIMLIGFLNLDRQVHWANALAFPFLVLAGALIAYSFWLFLSSTTFWFVRVDNVTELFTAVYETGRYPVTIYPAWVRLLITAVIPVALMTAIPVGWLLGREPWWYLFVATGIASVLFFASSRFFRFAIRSYTSASS